MRIKYDDLLTVPFKKGGRDKSGMDCYGLCIEMCRRAGKTLPDFATYGKIYTVNDMEFSNYVREIQQPKPGCLVEYLNADKEIHIGYVLAKDIYIHATSGGVRVTPLFALKSPKFYEVIK